jgi:tRNA nucleotidyltransferase (CCA-adding enzyme)
MNFNEHYFKEAKLDKWDELVQENPELKAAVEIMNIVTSKGFECVLVGGICRDLILGIKPADADLTTNATPNQIETIFPKVIDAGKNKSMGVSIVPYKGFNIEIATWRKDIYELLGNGKGADKVEITSSLEDDLSRRDIKINAI